jgi:hypothetical protein
VKLALPDRIVVSAVVDIFMFGPVHVTFGYTSFACPQKVFDAIKYLSGVASAVSKNPKDEAYFSVSILHFPYNTGPQSEKKKKE